MLACQSKEQPWKAQERHHANLTHGENAFFLFQELPANFDIFM